MRHSTRYVGKRTRAPLTLERCAVLQAEKHLKHTLCYVRVHSVSGSNFFCRRSCEISGSLGKMLFLLRLATYLLLFRSLFLSLFLLHSLLVSSLFSFCSLVLFSFPPRLPVSVHSSPQWRRWKVFDARHGECEIRGPPRPAVFPGLSYPRAYHASPKLYPRIKEPAERIRRSMNSVLRPRVINSRFRLSYLATYVVLPLRYSSSFVEISNMRTSFSSRPFFATRV